MFTKGGVWFALLFASLCGACGFVTYVAADDVTVSIGVGDTVLVVTGKTSPNAFVTIKSDDNVIGTTTASSGGIYSKAFSAQSPGLRKLDLSAHTPTGLTTDTVTLQLSVIEHAVTTAEVFLPTTVTAEDSGLDHVQPLQLKGETLPLSTVKIFLDNTEYIATDSDALGNWNISIDTRMLAAGQHQFFVRVIDGLGTQSYPTVSRFFTRDASPSGGGIQSPVPGLPIQTIYPPTITFPVSGAMWDESEITIKGVAARNVQVELWDGTRLLGSVWSDNNGDWSMNLILNSQEYNLRARACIDDRCSDFSAMTSFTHYASIQGALRIDVSQTRFTITRGEILSVHASVIGGHEPYATKLQWGDGNLDAVISTSNRLGFSHLYIKPGKYTAVLEVQDSQGRKGSVPLSIRVQDAPSSANYLLITILVILLLIALFVGARLFQHHRHKK